MPQMFSISSFIPFIIHIQVTIIVYIQRSSPNSDNKLTGGKEESGFEAGALRLTAGEDHGQPLAFRPVR